MAELTREGAIVVAANSNEAGACAEFQQRIFDPLAFGLAGARSVHKVAEEDNLLGS